MGEILAFFWPKNDGEKWCRKNIFDNLNLGEKHTHNNGY